jgi:ABC-type polar amino acid transport system ATPase subunit
LKVIAVLHQNVCPHKEVFKTNGRLKQHHLVLLEALALLESLAELAALATLLSLPLREVHGFEAGAAAERAMELLDRLGLKDHAGKRPAQLSGGQQQRAAIARALAPRPRLLLMDEPTSALDPVMTGEVLEVIRELAEEGQQIVLATHEVSFARRVADWVVFLAAVLAVVFFLFD